MEDNNKINKAKDKKYEDIDLSHELEDWQRKKFAKEGVKNSIESLDAPKLIKWTIWCSGGLIKNERQALIVLICIITLAIIIFILFFGNTIGVAENSGDIKILPAEI